MDFKIFIFFSFFYSINGQLVTVKTPRGSLVGYHVDNGDDTTKQWYGKADVFQGIPFAQPPVGNLRYKQPRPIVQYPQNPYNATYYRKACIQPTKNLDDISEDCLYVNIITPNASSTQKYPVMIWIHGGGLITGSGHIGTFGVIRNYVSRGIVVASLDYRMGWLGFFTTFTDDFPPNLGMLDQILALKFLKEELPYFGGDPNRITIFGQSAGGHSVSSHTYSPLSQNLFQQAIMESGTVFTCYEDSVGPTNRNINFAEKACNFTQQDWNSKNFGLLKGCLMNIDAIKGHDIADTIGAWNAVCWNMVQDNYFFPGNPQALYASRPNIPVMIGTCRDEYYGWAYGALRQNLSITNKGSVEYDLLHQYVTWFGDKGQDVLNIFEQNYLANGTGFDDHMAWLKLYIDTGTAAYFTWGSLRDVQYYVSNNNPNLYTYEFVWSSPVNDGGNKIPNYAPVPHGCELNYVFGFSENWSSDDKTVSKQVSDIWANFVKTGKPTSDGSWKTTTSTDPMNVEYWQFNVTSSMKSGYRATDQVVWNQEIPKILGESPPNLVDDYKLCQRGYQSKVLNITCYEAFNTPQTWSNAQTACNTNSYGSLATIASAFQNSDLIGYLKSTYPSCTSFYVGLFRSSFLDVQSSPWLWANYAPDSYRKWGLGYPLNDPNANCVVLDVNDGTWKNKNCDRPQCYICSN